MEIITHVRFVVFYLQQTGLTYKRQQQYSCKFIIICNM